MNTTEMVIKGASFSPLDVRRYFCIKRIFIFTFLINKNNCKNFLEWAIFMQKYTLLSGLFERKVEADGRPGRGPGGGGRLPPGAGHLPRTAAGLPGPPARLRGRRKRPGHLAPGHVLGPNDLDGGVGSGRDGAGHPGLQAAKPAVLNGKVSVLEILWPSFIER